MSFQSSGSFFRDVERELLSKYGFTRVDLFFDVLQEVPVGYGGPFHSEDGRFNMMASMVHRKGRPMSHAEAVAFYYPHGRPRYRPRPVLEDMEDACRYAFGSFTVRRPPSATEVSVGSYSDREWTL